MKLENNNKLCIFSFRSGSPSASGQGTPYPPDQKIEMRCQLVKNKKEKQNVCKILLLTQVFDHSVKHA
jgi:hypothetical protein